MSAGLCSVYNCMKTICITGCPKENITVIKETNCMTLLDFSTYEQAQYLWTQLKTYLEKQEKLIVKLLTMP